MTKIPRKKLELTKQGRTSPAPSERSHPSKAASTTKQRARISATRENPAHSTSTGPKYVTFMLDHEEYALKITAVREILRPMPITSLPGMPAYFSGVINLRGQVIPVVSLRPRLGFQPRDIDDDSRIIVVELPNANQAASASERLAPLGLIVDRVCEVIPIDESIIAPPPALQSEGARQMVVGLARIGSSVKVILDAANVYASAKAA